MFIIIRPLSILPSSKKNLTSWYAADKWEGRQSKEVQTLEKEFGIKLRKEFAKKEYIIYGMTRKEFMLDKNLVMNHLKSGKGLDKDNK